MVGSAGDRDGDWIKAALLDKQAARAAQADAQLVKVVKKARTGSFAPGFGLPE